MKEASVFEKMNAYRKEYEALINRHQPDIMERFKFAGNNLKYGDYHYAQKELINVINLLEALNEKLDILNGDSRILFPLASKKE